MFGEWKFTKPVHRPFIGCLNCGRPSVILNHNRILSVGFGTVNLKRDGFFVADFEIICDEDEKDYNILDVEKNIIIHYPDSDWRIEFNAPLHNETYQRRAPGFWVMIETGQGFA